MTQPPPREMLERVVRAALDEDRADRDATVSLLGLADTPVRAQIVAGEDAVISGVDAVRIAFDAMGQTGTTEVHAPDGTRVGGGDVVATVTGPARRVLGAERVALNFLQHLSGIATLTARYVDRVRGTGVTILDTRKTTPLLRDLEKYAVRCGGGSNHRRDLSDMVLVKENHVRGLGGRRKLFELLSQRGRGDVRVEVEVDSLAFFEEIRGAQVDRVMLDNFSPGQVAQALALLEGGGRAFEIEVSGGVTLDNVAEYALAGVDFISVGALTHSAPAISFSLEVV